MASLAASVFTIALANNLSQIFIFTDSKRMLEDLEYQDGFHHHMIKITEMTCDFIFNKNDHRRKLMETTPVVTVILHCPNMSQMVPEISPSDHVDYLLRPMLNLVYLDPDGDVHNFSLHVSRRFIIKSVYLIIPTGNNSLNKCLSTSVVTSDLHQVAVVDSSCGYHGSRQLVSDQFTGFGGHTFLVASIPYPLFIQPYSTTEGLRWTGFVAFLLEELAAQLDFTYKIVQPEDDQYGMKLPNGSWTGLVGMIRTKRADLIGGTFSIQYTRAEVVDYTYPYMDTHLVIVLQSPEVNVLSYIFTPLTALTWLIFITCVIIGVVYILVVKRLTDETPDRWHHLPGILVIETCRLLACQASVSVKESRGVKIVAVSLILMVLVVLKLYSGQLTVSLMVHKVKMPFTTLQGLVDDQQYKLYSEEGSVGHIVLKEAKKGILKALYQRLDGLRPFSVRYTATTPTASVADETYAKYQMMTNDLMENVIMLPEKFYPSYFAIALPKGGPFLPYFNDVMIRLHQNGMLQKWKNGLKRKASSRVKVKKELKVINNVLLSGAYVGLGVGLGTAVFVFIQEVISKMCFPHLIGPHLIGLP